jgi:hypothetical protein
MKVIVEYNLPEDEHDYECAIAGPKIRAAMSSFLRHLRDREKYNDKLSEDAVEELVACRQALGETLEEYGLWVLFQ